MLRIKKIAFQNFLSYGNVPTTVEFDTPGTTLILGKNLDDKDNGGSNGVGKSTIVNALVYGMYDKPISSISKDNLVNNINKKKMFVQVDFEKDGVYYRVYRCRKMKAGAVGNSVRFYVREKDWNFEEDDEIANDSIANANVAIEKAIGIPYELFVRIVVFSALHQPFLELPVRHPTLPSQTGIIEELFGLTILSHKSDALKEQIKETNRELNDENRKIETLKREHERHTELFEKCKKRVAAWYQNHEEAQHELYSDIVTLLNKCGIEVNLEDEEFDIDETKIDEMIEKSKEFDELNKQSNEIERQMTLLAKEILGKEKARKRMLSEIEALSDDNCPYCQQHYAESQVKIKEIEESLEEIEDIINKKNEELDQLEKTGEPISKAMDQIENELGAVDRDELREIKQNLKMYNNMLTEHNPHIDSLEELEDVDLPQLDYTRVNELTSYLEHQEFLLKLLTKKDSFVRKVLLNKNLPFLNMRIMEYLQAIGAQYKVQFNDDLTATITRIGAEMDFGNLSNGQKARVNLALSMTFRDILQQLHGKINMCLFDEVLDVGLDSQGVQQAAKMLKRIARKDKVNIMIISHRDEIGAAFDNCLIVQMQQGFSNILQHTVEDEDLEALEEVAA